MASITKRRYSSWQIAAKDSTLKVKRTFLGKSEALNFAKQLAADGIAVAKPRPNRGAMSNQRYPEEFKAEAVKQITERGHKVVDFLLGWE